jgi:two-component system NtrC family sensor kinase
VRRRQGTQAELLWSLGLVMALATVVQAAVLASHHEASIRDLLGRALLAEARAPARISDAVVPGTEWWTVHVEGRVEPRGPISGAIDTTGRALAAEARERAEPLLRPGALWERIRVAVPLESGAVAVAAVPRSASWQLRAAPLGVLGVVLLVDVVIFGALGVYLVRRRVVQPLSRLARTAHEIAAGRWEARAEAAGTAEVADLADSFNEMTTALESRTSELEKAVKELGEKNAALSQARAGLDRAERLAAVGRLAAGVAHEIGNPIGAILALVDLAGRDPGLGPGKAHLERAGREGLRVREILRQLLDFSRPPQPRCVPTDLAASAEEARALVAAQPDYAGLELGVVEEAGGGHALADPTAVLQILVNLLLNAGDAVLQARADGALAGRVELRIASVSDGVECRVSDDGTGIAADARERIFDPFFTTKPPGAGTGLGLANAARLAEELGGTLSCGAPEPGWQTTFRLRLPRSGRAAASGSEGSGAQESAVPAGETSRGPDA